MRRRLLLAIAIAFPLGCQTVTLPMVMMTYYNNGPETALEAHEWFPAPPTEQPLVERERAMALLELGDYEEVIAILAPMVVDLDARGVGPAATIRSEGGLFLGEDFERVMVPVVAMTAALALQQPDRAATLADHTLELARTFDPDPRRFAAASILAGLAYEAAGRIGAAETTFYEVGHRAPELRRVVGQLTRPVPGERSLVVILLVGEGPHKSEGSVTLPSGRMAAWPAYDRYEIPAPLVGRLRIDDGRSQPVTIVENLWTTARVGLGRRYDRLLAEVDHEAVDQADAEVLGETVGVDDDTASRIAVAFSESQDLIGWWSLPATVQITRVKVATAAASCRLSVVDRSGREHWGEEFAIPEEWREGPLFVVRRVP